MSFKKKNKPYIELTSQQVFMQYSARITLLHFSAKKLFLDRLKVTSSPLVLSVLIISTGKHTEWEEVVRGEDKDEAVDSYSKSGVNRREKVDKNHGTWTLPTSLLTVPRYPIMKA